MDVGVGLLFACLIVIPDAGVVVDRRKKRTTSCDQNLHRCMELMAGTQYQALSVVWWALVWMELMERTQYGTLGVIRWHL